MSYAPWVVEEQKSLQQLIAKGKVFRVRMTIIP
jgi:hypothetical protein